MIRYDKITMGEMTIKQNGRKYKIQIREGNCLAVFIHVSKNPESKGKDDKYIHTLYSFFMDRNHLKNMANNNAIFSDEVVSIKLNTYFKDCLTMLPFLTKAGYKVTCYYEKI